VIFWFQTIAGSSYSGHVRRKDFHRSRIYRMALKDGLELLPRFPAEPVFQRTGKGMLKSTGVQHLQKIKSHETRHGPRR
jgi:hypothetical protein